ncbi:MAG: Gfo/Idh/MocA family oxidoreductase [Chloroflexota bacterium]|nr:Gfo/Idh/MocA family oxidoreductase [Chloroflexia bacterium]MDQ3226535.1 Gfo/Idh/MocA family oxidoreductase [Chloroflexota bacterium]
MLHLQGFAGNPRAEVVAIAGLDEERCHELAKQFGVPNVYRDYQELIADPAVEAVTVAVPNILHFPVALAALEAGKHVMVEKPLAPTSQEGQKIIDAAYRASRVLGVVFNRRGRHDVQIVKREVERGNLGEIYHARAFWMRRSGIPGLGTWFTSKEMAGGGPLIDLGVHVIDMALWVLGNPTARCVSATTYAKLGPKGRGQWQGGRFTIAPGKVYEVEDFATAFIRFDSDLTLQVDAAWAAYTGHGDDFGLSLLGDNGGAEIHAKDYAQTGTLRFFGEIDGMPTVTEPRLLERHGHGEVFRQFIESVLDGTPMSPSGEEGLDRVRLIEAIYRSAELGREVEVGELDHGTQSAAGEEVRR